MLFDVMLLVLLVLAALPYTLGPILVRFTQRTAARPVFEPYDPARHGMREDVTALLRQTVDALLAEGFRVVADLYRMDGRTRTRAVLLAGATAGESALAGAGDSTHPKARTATCFVEFVTKFADGRQLSVQNNPLLTVFGRSPTRDVVWLPTVRDPARLWRVNRALLARRYGGVAVAPLDPGDDPAAFLSAAIVREMTNQIAIGYYRLDERAQAFRPTCKGAFLMSWKLLEPVCSLQHWLARRRARALLDQLGLAGSDRRAIPAPASPDPLRWSFVVLLGVLAFFVFGRQLVPGQLGRWQAPGSGGVPAEFTVPSEFSAAVRVLERLAGAPARPLFGIDTLGDSLRTPGFVVDVPAARAPQLITAAQLRFLERGFYLFRSEQHFGIERQPDQVALFPRGDPYEILRLMGTNGWNYGIGPDSVVAWLRVLERDHPFALTGMGFDWVEGRFVGEIRDPDALARRFYAFCPDIVDQGTETVAALAQELEESQALYCWWD